MKFLLFIAWWLTGSGINFLTIRSIDPCIMVKDLIMCLLTGIMGPFVIIYYFAFGTHKWLDKRVF